MTNMTHHKLKLANSCWQTQVGLCEKHNNSWQTCSKLATHVCQSFTRQIQVYQHEKVGEKVGENRDKFYFIFVANSLPTCLPTVCRLKVALDFKFAHLKLFLSSLSSLYFWI